MTNRWLVRRSYPFGQLRSELDRTFGDLYGWSRAPVGRAGARRGTYPAVNVWEEDDVLRAEAEVPGLKMEQLEILVQGDELTLKGEREMENREEVTYHRRERGFGSFSSVVRLPVEIDVDNVEARLEDGVLTVTLPKAPSARPRKIEVKTSNH
ncbi:MAG: Hsp20/alpha crystallin family protein [Gemmatimonadetes bacterium]|uniref:Hsp20/alpha crystallin family protein n=1 Tax=Candidatus Kutchimonas denitrificans TaxID=3056748 RepID=A0AAE4Z6Y6_9BACT|nr:Hsp20/alpha crystallin family protein [Gemmatimonadota bacterium]NIR74900.1 Hsp20/alpha crystallin family protein [Candidatus Kutchimonas denitrificans]NIS00012.1 Hsp20/alpha crystallin family protein [Gemmatimonadota bacterium]NIT65595.1 Hsp20/alpha crystallin family protein [Gemmatimonadota bacterium]NIU52565.1 Hsp20 family protein [Gemmatimonadota bacterium]